MWPYMQEKPECIKDSYACCAYTGKALATEGSNRDPQMLARSAADFSFLSIFKI